MPVTIDKFEYANDAAARAVWPLVAGNAGNGLVILFNETNAVFTDSSVLAQTVTNNGVTYTTSTDFSKGGVFPGNKYLSVPYSADLNPGTGDFYIAMRARFSSLATYSTILGQSTSGAMIVHLYNTRVLYLGVGNAGYQSECTLPSSITDGNDHLIEICRVSGVVSIYYDQSPQSVTGASNTTDYTFKSAAAICMGSQNGLNNLGACNVAEFMYIKGSGTRYLSQSSAYTVPAIVDILSESTIKYSGDYSMKVVALQTSSLNAAITRTVSPTINLTDQDEIKFKIRSSRTGTNLKIGFHDSGGTTTESNIAISSADTWEEKTIDISAVANANKDAIDLITITVTNADAENTIYLDEMLGYVTGEGTGAGGVSRARIVNGV